MEFVGIQDTYAESGQPDELLEKYGLVAARDVAAAVAQSGSDARTDAHDMPETGSLSRSIPGTMPGVSSGSFAKDLVFQRVYGPSAPVFGKPAEELTGTLCAETLGPGIGQDLVEPLRPRARRRDPASARNAAAMTSGIYRFTLSAITEEARYAGGLAHEMTPWSTAEQELRNTVLGALKAQEFERHMLSKFLHDVVGQNLTALGLQLDLVRMDLESVSPETCAADHRNPEGSGDHDGGGAGIQLRAEPFGGGAGRPAIGAGPSDDAHPLAVSRACCASMSIPV